MDPFARRVEEASLNAWPALTQLLYEGWIVRMTHGFTRRANSVTPLSPGGARDLIHRIRWCENFYTRSRQPTLFRVPEIPANASLVEVLRARGYCAEDPTRVLVVPLHAPPGPEPDTVDDGIRLTNREDWLDAYVRLTGEPEDARRLHDLVLRAIAGECLYALVTDRDRPLACALAVVEDDLVGLFDIVTDPAVRRRGHARTLVRSLHARARRQGARSAYLQVTADNLAAGALYEELGYSELHRYCYYRAPG